MNVYESIMTGLNEALEYAKGERDLRTVVLELGQSEENKPNLGECNGLNEESKI